MNRKTLFVDRRSGSSRQEDEICKGSVENLVERRMGVQLKDGDMLSDGGIIRESVLCAMLR